MPCKAGHLPPRTNASGKRHERGSCHRCRCTRCAGTEGPWVPLAAETSVVRTSPLPMGVTGLWLLPPPYMCWPSPRLDLRVQVGNLASRTLAAPPLSPTEGTGDPARYATTPWEHACNPACGRREANKKADMGRKRQPSSLIVLPPRRSQTATAPHRLDKPGVQYIGMEDEDMRPQKGRHIGPWGQPRQRPAGVAAFIVDRSLGLPTRCLSWQDRLYPSGRPTGVGVGALGCALARRSGPVSAENVHPPLPATLGFALPAVSDHSTSRAETTHGRSGRNHDRPCQRDHAPGRSGVPVPDGTGYLDITAICN